MNIKPNDIDHVEYFDRNMELVDEQRATIIKVYLKDGSIVFGFAEKKLST